MEIAKGIDKYRNLKEIIELLEDELDMENENVSATLDLEDLKELRELLEEVIRLGRRINIQAGNIGFVSTRACALEVENDELKEFKIEHGIMKRIIVQNGLWERFLNDDEFIKHLKSKEKRLLRDVDEDEWSTKCEFCGGELYEDWTCTKCGRYMEHK